MIVIIGSGERIQITAFTPIATSYAKCLPNAFNTMQSGNRSLLAFDILGNVIDKPFDNSPYIVSLVVHSFFDPIMIVIVTKIEIVTVIMIITCI